MSLLTMVQGVMVDLGLPSPSSVVGNGDDQVAQFLQIAKKEGRDLASRFKWSKMIFQNTFTIAASEDQGLFNSTIVSTNDYDYMIPETFWNQTTAVPIVGPMSFQEWEAVDAIGISGPFPAFLERSGKMFLKPAPTVGAQTGSFEYKSTSWCETSGAVGLAEWTNDNDVGRLDENLMALGITWRWLKRKGLDYGEDFTTYEKRILEAFSRDGGRRTLRLGGRFRGPFPNIIVPFGNWLQ